jgi:flagellar biogenesis protein FliO
MPLGLVVSLAMLGVITILGALGYLMDKLVNRDERKDGH